MVCLATGAVGLGEGADVSVCTFGGKVSGVALNGAVGPGMVVGLIPGVALVTGNVFSTNTTRR